MTNLITDILLKRRATLESLEKQLEDCKSSSTSKWIRCNREIEEVKGEIKQLSEQTKES